MVSIRRLAVVGASLLALVSGGAGPVAAEENARGRELYGFCQQCHGEDGGGNELYLAPAIAGLPVWYLNKQLQQFHAGVRGAYFDDLTGMRMRPMALWLRSEEDMLAVSQYIAALPAVDPPPLLLGGDATKGAALFATCTACHGPQGKGMEVLGAPPIDHASDWYLLTQLKHFKQGLRGANPKAPQAMTMRPMAMLLPDEQAMKDVIAYIMTLDEPQAKE